MALARTESHVNPGPATQWGASGRRLAHLHAWSTHTVPLYLWAFAADSTGGPAGGAIVLLLSPGLPVSVPLHYHIPRTQKMVIVPSVSALELVAPDLPGGFGCVGVTVSLELP